MIYLIGKAIVEKTNNYIERIKIYSSMRK